MISRKAMTASASTVLGLGAFAAVAMSSGAASNAGKTTPVAPVVRTEVRTKHKVVHVKPKPRRVTVASASPMPGGAAAVRAQSASRVSVSSTPAAGTTLRQASQVAPAAPSPSQWESEDHSNDDHGYEDDGRAREDHSNEDYGHESEGWDD